jgi:hypothetical protein
MRHLTCQYSTQHEQSGQLQKSPNRIFFALAMKPEPVRLPFQDAKPQGAADFYFAINATFRFVHAQRGREGWVRYLREMAVEYFAPVNTLWREGGLPAVAGYWRAFFAAEPDAKVDVREEDNGVTVEVRQCPAIHHLRRHAREIVPYFCHHCYHLNNARAEAAGFCMRLSGGNGQCRQTFSRAEAEQDMAAIREVPPC